MLLGLSRFCATLLSNDKTETKDIFGLVKNKFQLGNSTFLISNNHRVRD